MDKTKCLKIGNVISAVLALGLAIFLMINAEVFTGTKLLIVSFSICILYWIKLRRFWGKSLFLISTFSISDRLFTKIMSLVFYGMICLYIVPIFLTDFIADIGFSREVRLILFAMSIVGISGVCFVKPTDEDETEFEKLGFDTEEITRCFRKF